MGSTKTTVMESESVDEKQAVSAKATPSQEKSAKKAKVRGKKYLENKAKIDKTKLYKLVQAVKLVKETNYASFNASIEFHATVKKQDLSVQVALPNSTGREKTIEFADEKTIEKLEKNKVDFDILLATAEMMPKLVKYARILGPKGMMPNPKNGTLVKSSADAKNFSIDKLTIKTERKFPLIHTVVGKVNLEDKKLIENIEAIVGAINKRQIVKANLTSTMGPSVKLLVE